MKEKERDIWDDAIRSKFDDFEMDTMPGDWEAIADRLPGKSPIPLRRTLRYWVAAAVASLLVVSGGIYLFDQDTRKIPMAREVQRQNEAVESRIKESQVVEPVLAAKPDEAGNRGGVSVPVLAKARTISTGSSQPMAANIALMQGVAADTMAVQAVGEPLAEVDQPVGNIEEKEKNEAGVAAISTKSGDLIAEVAPVSKKKNKNKDKNKNVPSRKWGFGMGGGGFSMGADNLVPQYVTNSAMFKSENLTYLNAVETKPEETDIEHKTPIGLGISISRYLNSRFALQTGLTYSYLRSEWTTGGTYHVENDQRLHFIGIPLSLTFKIAEWNRLMFYASAGAMTEVNVAGKRRMKLFSDDNEIVRESEKVRMKEWLWSVNTCVGVSYPIIRFVSAFAEVGAAYYFDNGSVIETIHSEKPFNVNLQFGFRLGF